MDREAEKGRKELEKTQEVINSLPLEVRISRDGMLAEARLLPAWEPGDGGHTDVSLPVLTADMIRAVLGSQGVCCGIQAEALKGLPHQPGHWVEVARGIPPVQGRSGFVEYYYEDDLKPVVHGEDKARVDFRDRFNIQQVESGEIMARIHPPVEGSPGVNVFGEAVHPEPVYPVEVRCREGVALSAHGTRVVAQVRGRPVCSNKGRSYVFKVENFYIHRGSVNMRSGNLYFQGNLLIKGSVEEGMKVIADGDVEVKESSGGALLKAGGSILLHGNCIQCQVQAGARDIFLEDFYLRLTKLEKRMEQARRARHQLLEALKKRGYHAGDRFPVLFVTLIKIKFSDLEEMAKNVLEMLEHFEFKLARQFVNLGEECRKFLGCLQGDLQPEAHVFDHLFRRVRQVCFYIRFTGKSKMGITAHYVQNSNLTCTGDILVNGPGSYHSNFRCSGTVRIEQLFRGGSIVAGGDVYIGEAGSPSPGSLQGIIEVSPGNSVFLGKVYDNISIKIGNSCHNFSSDLFRVRVFWDGGEQSLAIKPWLS